MQRATDKPKTVKAVPKAKPAETLYPSNPLRLVAPAWRGLRLNWRAVLAVTALALLAGLAIIMVLAVILTANNAEKLCSTGNCSAGALAPVVIGAMVGLGLAAVYLGPIVIRLVLAMARQQQPKLDELLTFHWRTGWRVLLTALLSGIIVSVGFILFIVPGIFALMWFMFACYLVVDEDLKPVDALYRSRALVRGRIMEVGGVLGLYFVVDVIDFVPFLGNVFYLPAMVLLVPVTALRYTTMHDLQQSQPAEAVPIARSNYWWFYCGAGLMVLAFSLFVYVVVMFYQTGAS